MYKQRISSISFKHKLSYSDSSHLTFAPLNRLNTPIFLVGPTSSGKSALALSIARRREPDRHAILCLDAMQIYRGASIGTNKPTVEEQSEIPHGGLDLVNLGEPFSVADYLDHAQSFLSQHRDRQILVVGGTGLYFRALTRGLCLAPEAPAELRESLNALTVSQLQERLQRIDPLIYSRLDVNNPRRLIRAIEVMEFTGRSLAQWQAETPPPLIPEYRAYLLQRPKEELRARIEQQVHSMLKAGWVEEVRSLTTSVPLDPVNGCNVTLPSVTLDPVNERGSDPVLQFAAIGYREIAEHLRANPEFAEDQSLPEKLVATIVQETQQYAKRQLTWFAREPSLIPVSMTKDLETSVTLDPINRLNQQDVSINGCNVTLPLDPVNRLIQQDVPIDGCNVTLPLDPVNQLNQQDMSINGCNVTLPLDPII